jgi:hypothetical protein
MREKLIQLAAFLFGTSQPPVNDEEHEHVHLRRRRRMSGRTAAVELGRCA